MHLPVVLLPLAALGVLVMVLRPAWHRRYRWALLAVGSVGAVGAVLAASAGESLEGQIVAKEGRAAAAGWEDHAGMGDTARVFAIVLLIALALFVLVPWFLEWRKDHDPDSRSVGPRWLGPVLAAVALLCLRSVRVRRHPGRSQRGEGRVVRDQRSAQLRHRGRVTDPACAHPARRHPPAKAFLLAAGNPGLMYRHHGTRSLGR